MLLNTTPGNATVWRVNNNPNYTQGCTHCFNSLQAANDDSLVLAGDTIHLEASNILYSGPGNKITINKPLVIIGPGYFLSQNPGLQKNTLSATIIRIEFLPNSENSVLKGVRIFGGSGSSHLTILASYITVENCYIEDDVIIKPDGNNITDIFIKKCFVGFRVIRYGGGTGYASNVFVRNTYIRGSIDFLYPNYPVSGEVNNCIIAGIGSGNLEITSYIYSFFNNIVANTLIQNDNGSNVFSNIFIGSLPGWAIANNGVALPNSTVFPSTGSPDSILNVNPIGICPECYTGAPSGTETMGIYGGVDPYQLSGIPNIPSIYQLQAPLNTIQGVPVNVNISTRSND